jgi:RNA polymerase-binding transcription factor DksA
MAAKVITKEDLLKQQQELIERVTAIKNDFGKGLDPDLEEQAVQLENYEVLMRLLENATIELGNIEKQLAKMNRGSKLS